jgi:predicted CoA-binding protein
VRLLVQHGHDVVPVNPTADSIEGIPVVASVEELSGQVDTVTIYVSAKISTQLERALLSLRPGRVIFNPGAENPALRTTLQASGIATEEACTLVLLTTGQF